MVSQRVPFLRAPSPAVARRSMCRLAFAAMVVGGLAAPPGTVKAQNIAVEERLPAEERADVKQQARMLQTDLRQSRRDVGDLAGRLPKLERELEELGRTADSLQVRNKRPTANQPGPEPAKMVQFRPPIERLTDKPGIHFRCQEGRISFVDFDEINEKIKPYLSQRASTFNFDLTGSDFRIEGRGNGDNVTLTVVAKVKLPGETPEELKQPDSRFHKRLATRAADDFHVKFSVWPDSYDVFRAARSEAWNLGFEAGWTPMLPNEEQKLTRGVGPESIQ